MGVVQMKGQVFIILAVFLLLGLMLLRVTTRTISEGPKNFLPENFLNLKNELTHIVDISLLKNENIQANLNQFVSFSTDILKQKGYEENVQYSVDQVGSTTTVKFNLILSLDKEYLNDSFSVERTVYG